MSKIFTYQIVPTSHGSYSSGEKIVNKTIVFTGAGSIDNDSQDGGYTPKWEWSVSADGVIWGSSYMYTTSTFTYTFTTADTFFIRVRFCDNDGQWGAYYTFTIEIIDCKRYYYVKDHPSTSSGQVLGNISQTVDENGVIISAQDYSPYGEIIRSYNNADANDKYKFTEKERDKETNLDYFGARYYDASIGMWLTPDPLSDLYPGQSPYCYVSNNPMNMVDLWGLEGEPAEEARRKLRFDWDNLYSEQPQPNFHFSSEASKSNSGTFRGYPLNPSPKGLEPMNSGNDATATVLVFVWTKAGESPHPYVIAGAAIVTLGVIIYEAIIAPSPLEIIKEQLEITELPAELGIKPYPKNQIMVVFHNRIIQKMEDGYHIMQIIHLIILQVIL